MTEIPFFRVYCFVFLISSPNDTFPSIEHRDGLGVGVGAGDQDWHSPSPPTPGRDLLCALPGYPSGHPSACKEHTLAPPPLAPPLSPFSPVPSPPYLLSAWCQSFQLGSSTITGSAQWKKVGTLGPEKEQGAKRLSLRLSPWVKNIKTSQPLTLQKLIS